MEKNWNIKLNSVELTIVMLAVEKYVAEYDNTTFTPEELASALVIVRNPIHDVFL